MTLIEQTIAALRSGKYKQEQGALCVYQSDDPADPDPIGYCCLGVMTHLHNPDHMFLQPGHTVSLTRTNSKRHYLPEDVMTRIVEESGGDVNKRHTFVTWDNLVLERTEAGVPRFASTWNDEGQDFNQIADALEKAYKEDPQSLFDIRDSVVVSTSES